ncbi:MULTISPECIES: 5-(carboxyamino)imidazole ribonucleotide synthase [Bacillaceae]|uniref:5-(carboxyamino)imidazole ribonucleotide synthase n=1 Tax=Bacillaceae TaxID=186817 RepID=UPI00203ACDF0|nr:5-(carboxyamino)imidazole ribonucleotide synthase [Caldibacillus thermoamylovorans]MCM3055765.1 5-(carboxyamino)imidazole ribonucleotide synthase [Caldibacillus thermoamylovorans]MCM3478387.1 5-(carboxyamino)imidazole ribonucleotide synthase [Caldibacillus thermoamylovorans]
MISLFKTILPGQTIGVIGGGQLGQMMTLAAKSMGFRVIVLDPTPNSPCGQVADEQIVAAYNDLAAVKILAEKSDVITYEFENIDANALSWLTNHAYVPQGTEILRVTQNRIYEKATIQKAGVPVVPYEVILNQTELEHGLENLGYPAVLKAATGGYDGKGQLVIKTEHDRISAASLLSTGPCVLEQWIPFTKEVSVIVSKNPDGETAVFPVAENIHCNNILHQTIVPARIDKKTEERAMVAAKKIAEFLHLIGTLAVEMFVTEDGEIYINELAPRPHNSGHYSIEACMTSQFEQHIRAICNLPLGSTALLKPAVMVNILGEHLDPLLENLHHFKHWKIHLYGKNEAKPGRKMGHLTRLCNDTDEALQELEENNIW